MRPAGRGNRLRPIGVGEAFPRGWHSCVTSTSYFRATKGGADCGKHTAHVVARPVLRHCPCRLRRRRHFNSR